MLTTFRAGAGYGAVFAPSSKFQPYGFSEALIPLIGAGSALASTSVTTIASAVQAGKSRKHDLAMQEGSGKLALKESKLAAQQAKVEAAKAAAEEAKASSTRAVIGWTAGAVILLGLAGIFAWTYVKKNEEK
jgi:malic enzyme